MVCMCVGVGVNSATLIVFCKFPPLVFIHFEKMTSCLVLFCS